MPRLSVDIDLTYLPIENRETTLKTIDTILENIREDLLRNLRGVSVQRIAGGGNNDTRILVRQGNAEMSQVLGDRRTSWSGLRGCGYRCCSFSV